MNSQRVQKALRTQGVKAASLALGLILALSAAPQVTFAQDHGHFDRGNGGGDRGGGDRSSNGGGNDNGGGWQHSRDSQSSNTTPAPMARVDRGGSIAQTSHTPMTSHATAQVQPQVQTQGQRGYTPSDGYRGRDDRSTSRYDPRASDRGRDDHRDDHNSWNDHRGDDRDRDRGHFDWHNDRHFNGYSGVRLGFYFAPDRGYYRVPDQYYGHRWGRGEYLPSFFFNERITDPGYYDLPYPPYGCAWYLVGEDAVLVDIDTGQIVNVIYGVF